MHSIGKDSVIKAVIFDFDGVLAESTDIKTSAFARLFRNESPEALKLIVNYHLQNAGVSRFEKIRYIYKNILRRPLKENIFQQLCDEFSFLVKEEVIKAPFVAGAGEFLKKFYRQYSLYVISATPREEIEEIIAARKMTVYFQGIYGSPEEKSVAVKKIIFKEQLGRNEVVYIGDALSDYQAAVANGVNFIARIHNNESLFAGIDCPRKPNLLNLADNLKTFST